MTIRSATEQDIPSIVQLLKLSLGESLMPKSEAFWKWKHIDNPFGKSPVLVAEDNNQLIGVRAFMRWEWKEGDTVYKAVRAVDTATHPQHQGKGIFKKLTLQLVEQCKNEGTDFIFNTPNASSKPGYIKMGWESAGRLKIRVRPVLFYNKQHRDFENQYAAHKELSLPELNAAEYHTKIITNHSTRFWKWRYQQNPNVNYYRVSDKQSYMIFFRLKPYRFGMEFRICDVVMTQTCKRDQMVRDLKKAIRSSGANLVTSTEHIDGVWMLSLNKGPEMTTRLLSAPSHNVSWNNWKPSLGDMEVF